MGSAMPKNFQPINQNKRSMKKYLYIILSLLFYTYAVGAQEKFKGRVIDAQSKEPLAGVLIKVNKPEKTILTDNNGFVELNLPNGTYQLQIQYLGYANKSLDITLPLTEALVVSLDANAKQLETVQIVSTGYQQLPKERATGSFTQLSEKELNRSVGINILDRLEGITSGLLLNRGLPNTDGQMHSKLAVHGRSTLFANAEPTIVLDGFPYEGSIEQINPADISSITVLKDAAAASIWGAKAGNGVIVINTKQGHANQKTTILANAAITIGNRPDVFYRDQVSVADFIDLEEFGYESGLYNTSFNTPYSPVSKAVEIFDQRKKGLISNADATAELERLKQLDVRNELLRYAYRPSVYQQYQTSISGGTANQTYYLSGGYDRNLENSVTNNFDRVSINARNSYTLVKDRLTLNGALAFASSNAKSKSDPYAPYSPYDELMDANGTALPTVKNLRLSYIDTAGRGNLLDWHYRPIDDMLANALRRQQQYRANFGIDLKLINGLNLVAQYQYLKEHTQANRNFSQDSYYARNMINTFSSIVGNTLYRAVPLGGIKSFTQSELSSKILRFQLNFGKTIGENHQINAIAGYEGGDVRSTNLSQMLYGFQDGTLANGNNAINPMAFYPYYYEKGSSRQLATAADLAGINNISQSYYANLAYTFRQRYMFSASARRDESNLFGVASNQKGVPLWSLGLAWLANREHFLEVDWLTTLKLRATYGHNGNVDKSTSGLLTLRNSGQNNVWGSNYSLVLNPPNPALRWEKVKTTNLGIDASFFTGRLSFSIDVYQKNATDLIGNHPIALQSGVAQFKGNGADLRTNGVDVMINSLNINTKLNWSSTLLFNYNKDEVTKYRIKQLSNANIVASNFNNPLQGYPYYAVFSLPSAGLNEKGEVQGYVAGQISTDYTAMLNLLDPAQLKFHGSATPKYFGSLINNFGFGNLELSVNVSYKLGYFFRRSGVFNGSFSKTADQLASYEKRWQKVGDEASTRIPALIYPTNNAMGTFFNLSEDLVEPADHIRLQDIRLSYQLPTLAWKGLGIDKVGLFFYARNLGVVYTKNKLGIDPDYGTNVLPAPLTFSFGFNLNFR
ncbi:MAG: SusC/RagA family TonB-linked outer membrane protein [Flavobacteriales bacterium]|nr:MAG: SusC/RagA family TonB-linked outer membrane protein [Flavobacteriales bacterium]